MAKYIDCEAAIDALDMLSDKMTAVGQTALQQGIDLLKDMYAADVRPVVLCRDCKHKGWIQEPEHGKSVDYCRLIERCVDKQFFCAAGERKTNCGADMRKGSAGMTKEKILEMKPCPFCGGEARVSFDSQTTPFGEESFAFAFCTSCGIRTPRFYYCPEQGEQNIAGMVVADRWNRRTENDIWNK